MANMMTIQLFHRKTLRKPEEEVKIPAINPQTRYTEGTTMQMLSRRGTREKRKRGSGGKNKKKKKGDRYSFTDVLNVTKARYLTNGCLGVSIIFAYLDRLNTPQRSTPNSSSSGRHRADSNLSITLASVNGRAANRVSASRPTIAVANKLRAAIKTDLEKRENEVHTRYIRAGGFWRYVRKTVFEKMTEIARELDVGSGKRWEKKRVREE